MSLPKVVSPAEWRAARVALLEQEKAMTRARDALNERRRELPMVRIEKDYALEGPDGEARLIDLFEGRRQLMVGHFMFDPEWEEGWAYDVFHTYSTYARGAEMTGGSYYFLDLTALGRQEDREEPKGRAAAAHAASPDFAA